MPYPYWLSLAPNVQVVPAGAGLAVVDTFGRSIIRKTPGPDMRRLLECLASGGGTADTLCGAGNTAELHYLLLRLGGRGMLSYAMTGRVTARLDPASPTFAFREEGISGSHRLSRFACLRRIGDEAVLECPLGHGRVRLGGAAASAMVGLLAEPRSAGELAAAVPGMTEPEAGALLCLLINAGAVLPCDADGRLPEDSHAALRQWEFHDLLFHTRSRSGRHNQPVGGTFRFLKDIEALPAVKAVMSERRISLHCPGPDAEDVPFRTVLAHRRSLRRRGAAPMEAEALGTFLHHVARIQDVLPAAPLQGPSYEISHRPCPSGGATHSIELYLTIHRVAGLEPGFYHYAPLDHALERISGSDGAPGLLIAEAMAAAGLHELPDMLITLASRFPRVTWKYQSIAYALMLKDAGALIQQMYLVATALGLAPNAIGSGDSDLFARAAGTDYFEETSVAEFILSGLS